jgi:integration host factor subunit beta
VTKSELIAILAARYPQLAVRDTDLAVKTVLDAMTQALAEGQRIEIRGFGSFSLSERAPRVGRNPKSGEQVMVPGKQVPHFKAGKELRERVDADEPLALTVSGQLDTNSSSDRSTLDQGLVTRQVAL